MKLVTFLNDAGERRAGWVQDGTVIDMQLASGGMLPVNLLDFIQDSETYLPIASRLQISLQPNAAGLTEERPWKAIRLADNRLCAPLPLPSSLRDFYAFEDHVKTARARRGLAMVPEWYEIPVFYFSNHRCIKGPDEPVPRPKNCRWLDFELEIACVIGKQGRNIRAEEADEYIIGYCIMNDWSARDIQQKEAKVGLGPAKGKDFATSLGPYLVTKDELSPYRAGDRYDLEMTAKVNGRLLSRGNVRELYYSFGQMIERASEDADLVPGDVIGSGTVGSGCILELGTAAHRWLEPGDEVELEITGLGVLKNKVV